MFKTEKVDAYMQKANFEGKGEAKVVRFEFYITPITFELAEEISPIIATSLFTKSRAGKFSPVLGLDGPSFDIGTIELQKIYLYPSADKKMHKEGVMLDRAEISHLNAFRLFPNNPNFTLAFRAEVPMDKHSVEVARRYYKEQVFLSFEEMQLELPLNANPKCEECENDAVCRDEKGNYFCEKDRKKAKGEVTYIAKKQSPAEAAAEDKGDPEADDTSHINRGNRKK